ncbi:DsbE family thiol:disulfide interchange protein [Chitinibacter fontanus]|uniref:DsbE family thiol:disulfide interchange protein n=1 Tax=Chitinibacter fontanus TaxID=1737446 RepID=A0A7D5ZKV5_9NEIS|nr:DsbE family thiol:disulfide interchange protein [Chitinibacter fontanus]QLI82150.1 DsbE family thiol:disulfide interchange protein [Chitinibacter fontanus]
MKRFVPLIIFVALAALLSYGLRLNPRDIPSPLIGKPAPVFTLDRLDNSGQFSTASLNGQPWVLNVWASWCTACVVEHPVLNAWKDKLGAPLVGLAYKDADDDAKKWLAGRGNPYSQVLADRDGRVGIDFGVYGVPETFVIDGKGIIRLKHTGPVTDEVFKDKIIPALQSARVAGAQ